MDTLEYIINKFANTETGITLPVEDMRLKMPIEIPNFGRNQLAELFAELKFNKGAEIGVEQGEYSEILLKANPNLRLLCVDAWQSHRGYRDHTSQSKLDRFYEITKERLAPYNDPLNRVNFMKSFSIEAVKGVEDNSLDFVYIDADHQFITVANDIFEWSKKVRPGGIIAGHDYIDYSHVHVKKVLPGYMEAYKISPWFVCGSEAKVEGQIRDDSRSWFFIKQ